MLIQTGRPLSELDDADIAEFAAAITAREQAHDRQLQHYRTALHATRRVLYHLDGQVTPTAKNTAHLRWPWRRHFAGVPTAVADSLVAYLECASPPAPVRPCSVSPPGSGTSPGSSPHRSRADLAGRAGSATPHRALPGRVAAARNPRTGAPLSASERRSRVLTVGRLIDDINEWGWAERPAASWCSHAMSPDCPAPCPATCPRRRPAAHRRAARLAEPAARRRVAAAARHRDAHR